MKRKHFLSLVLFLILSTSCSPQKSNASLMIIKPYEISEKELDISQTFPVPQGNIHFYEVSLLNKQDEVHTTLEYYQHGEKIKDIAWLSSAHFQEKTIKLSFAFNFNNETPKVREWFMNIEGSSYKGFEELSLNITDSSFAQINEPKKIKYNTKVPLAVWVNNLNPESTSVFFPENKKILEQLIQKNEHVYLYSVEIKGVDALQ
ncbi:hypothetical protein [Bacillus gaemokensis]|uniref:Lipoprotein n=1 Tax=Bacillus gaemokensis TaxID=574375 RepID=A0A073K9C1_9BACI|nr:hypothetical protein [Bacillus gaemokensis]KEK23170.1 hypothetical protein BAGA_10455 [Bacillus gaemokensis]KYG37615.1 hypothetical protein AZF08_22805 [Bacillus gaemokensis]